jgi:hypothetical protein
MSNQKIERCKIDTPNVHCFVLDQALKENRKEISVFTIGEQHCYAIF